MKTKDARALAEGITRDLDNAMAGKTRPEEERHTAAMSAVIVGARLLGGVAINVARIAHALERIADNTEPEAEP